MRHSAANLLRRVTLIGILHCCEAYQGCSVTLLVDAKSNAYRYFTLLRSISGVQRHAAAAGSHYILPFATSYVFVYDDNYAGQALCGHAVERGFTHIFGRWGIQIAPQAAATSAMRLALRGSMNGHFTCSFVAERFKSTFHVFANWLAKTFHFCAEVMFASRSHISAQKFHVRSKGAFLRLSLIVPLRRT